MHPSALLDLVAELVHAVLQFEAPADATVSSFFRKHRELGIRERQLELALELGQRVRGR